MRATITIQNVLLERLAQARADDGIVDFAKCIDISDEGCTEASIALRQLYQRQLEKSSSKKEDAVEEVRVTAERPAVVPRMVTAPSATLLRRRPDDVDTRAVHIVPQVESVIQPTERRSPRGLRRILPSRGNEKPRQNTMTQPTYHRANTAPADIRHPVRRSTTTSLNTSPNSERSSRLSMSSQNSSNPEQSQPTGRGVQPQDWTQGMSRAPTLGSMASIESVTRTPSIETAKIKIYGGSCKYAFQIREKGPKGNLEAQNLATYTQNWVYKCSSSKCKFGKPIQHPKAREPLDNTIYNKNGIEFRWLFLAKSHCMQNEASPAFPFVCLICQLLSGDPKQYLGIDELFAHIAEHQEDQVGGVSLEGPLTFSNRGITTGSDFDLKLPERQRPPQRRTTGQDSREQEMSQVRSFEDELDRHSKTSSMESQQTDESSLSAQTDLYVNHWA